MDSTTALGLIVTGALVPFMTAIFTRPDMQSGTKRLITVAVSVFMGVLTALVTGLFVGVPPYVTAWIERFVIMSGIVIALSQGYYRVLKDSVSVVEDKAGV